MARQKSLPAMPLFGGDWVKRTAALPADVRGYYVDLLIWCWEHREALPDDDQAQMQIARCTDGSRWSVAWRLLSKFWVRHKDGWRDDQTEESWRNYERFRANQSAAGRASAAARAARRQPHHQPYLQPHDEPMREPESHPHVNRETNHPSTDASTATRTEVEPSLSLSLRDQERSGGPPPREPPNIGVLTRLAHETLDKRDAGKVSDVDLAEDLKSAASRASLAYHSDAIRKALESAQWQRDHQTARQDPAGPPLPSTTAQAVITELLADHGGTMELDDLARIGWQHVRERFAEDPEYANRVIAALWNPGTIRNMPAVSITNGVATLEKD